MHKRETDPMRTCSDPPDLVDAVRGDTTGLSIPAHSDALRVVGEAFLTNAFRKFGALSQRDRVVRIARFEPFPGGNSGHKVFLSVVYAHPEPSC